MRINNTSFLQNYFLKDDHILFQMCLRKEYLTYKISMIKLFYRAHGMGIISESLVLRYVKMEKRFVLGNVNTIYVLIKIFPKRYGTLFEKQW
jgi:hypothetical protein